jgi:hypothetical protein
VSYLFALISETPLVRPGDLYRLAEALEVNGQHCAALWGTADPAIVVVDSRARLPRSCHPIVFVDGEGDPGALAVHYWDPVRSGPAARVYVDRGSGLNSGDYSVCEAASHEVTEALVDPRVNLWADHPTRAPVQVAIEVADPVQDTYEVVGRDGTRWRCTNFVTPQWFDPQFADPLQRARLRDAGLGFDYAQRLSEPGEVGPEGYVILRSSSRGVWFENRAMGSDLVDPRNARRVAAKAHPMSRARARGLNVSPDAPRG